MNCLHVYLCVGLLLKLCNCIVVALLDCWFVFGVVVVVLGWLLVLRVLVDLPMRWFVYAFMSFVLACWSFSLCITLCIGLFMSLFVGLFMCVCVHVLVY